MNSLCSCSVTQDAEVTTHTVNSLVAPRVAALSDSLAGTKSSPKATVEVGGTLRDVGRDAILVALSRGLHEGLPLSCGFVQTQPFFYNLSGSSKLVRIIIARCKPRFLILICVIFEIQEVSDLMVKLHEADLFLLYAIRDFSILDFANCSTARSVAFPRSEGCTRRVSLKCTS